MILSDYDCKCLGILTIKLLCFDYALYLYFFFYKKILIRFVRKMLEIIEKESCRDHVLI